MTIGLPWCQWWPQYMSAWWILKICAILAWQGPLFALWSTIFAANHLKAFLLVMLCDLSGPTQKRKENVTQNVLASPSTWCSCYYAQLPSLRGKKLCLFSWAPTETASWQLLVTAHVLLMIFHAELYVTHSCWTGHIEVTMDKLSTRHEL